MCELKNNSGVIYHGNEEWCKNWGGIDLPVQNWNEEFNKFWLKHSKISKMCTLPAFDQSILCLSSELKKE